MNTILNLVSENTLIEGVKKVSDKVYKFKAIYDRKFVEATKYEYVNIIKGLETVICYTNDGGYDYYEVVETTTGTVLSYYPIQNSDKKESKKAAIEKAEKLVNELAETGKLVDVLTKVAVHIHNDISPSYEGDLKDKNDRSSELNNIGIGDRLFFINLRGGLHCKTAVVESMKTVTRCNKEVIEYKVIDDKTGYYSYYVFDNRKNDSNFYYEPQFVEMMEKASSENVNPQTTELEVEIIEDDKVVTIENTEALVNQEVALEVISNETIENAEDFVEDEVVIEIAKSPYKTILQEYEGMENLTGHYLYNVVVADDKESLMFIYKYGEDETTSTPIRKCDLEDDPYINGLIEKYPNSCEQQILIRETELNIAGIIFGLYEENRVYKLEEIVRSGISLRETPVLTEDLTNYTNEEFYHKQRAIWDVLHSSERLYRWEIPQSAEQLVIRGYNEVILHNLFSLLTKDSQRRGRLQSISMDEETAKGYALKWIYSDRYQEVINKGDRSSLEKSLKHDFYGGTLCGEYGFFIGSVNCTSKGASICLYPDMKNYPVEKYKMTYKEIADRLIKKYQVKEIKKDIEIVKSKPIANKDIEVSNTETAEKEQLTLFTLTNEDIEKLSATVKKNRNKKNLVEGQMTLFAM